MADPIRENENSPTTPASSAVNGTPQTLEEYKQECERLRQELASVTADRDVYLNSLKYLLVKDVKPITEEEMEELIRDAVPAEDLIKEVEQILATPLSEDIHE